MMTFQLIFDVQGEILGAMDTVMVTAVTLTAGTKPDTAVVVVVVQEDPWGIALATQDQSHTRETMEVCDFLIFERKNKKVDRSKCDDFCWIKAMR